MDETIYDLVRKAEQNDQQGSTTISKYVTFDMRENIEKIDAYLNSKHISGDTDDMGREKPFFNIVTAAVNIWYRATDIDRKNIRIKASKAGDTVLSFLGTVHLQQWMRKSNFGQFLNEHLEDVANLSKKQGLQAWVTYNTGAYKKYLAKN